MDSKRSRSVQSGLTRLCDVVWIPMKRRFYDTLIPNKWPLTNTKAPCSRRRSLTTGTSRK